MRLEFTKQTMREALKRADGLCEGLIASGDRCNGALTIGKYHFDHVIPAAIGGDNSLTNCAVLCLPCHLEKTTKRDIPIIAKSKRVSDLHLGIKLKKRRPMPGSKASGLKKRMNGTIERRT